MNMFWHELRAYRKSTITWTITMVALAAMMFSMYPTFAKDAGQFKAMLEGMPDTVLKAMGLDMDTITSLLGFYAYTFAYIALCGAIQAMNLGTSIVSKEVREKTADFLLTKPVTRSQIITSKLSAAVVSLILTNVIYLAGAFLMASVVRIDEYSFMNFFLISISLLFVQLMFLALGFVISVLARKIKSVLPISLGTVFAFFFIGVFGATTGDQTVRYFTPFKYVDVASIAKGGGYETPFVIIAILFIAAAIVSSYVVYVKKDIHAV
jgi:ABC-2 type transport system permease protein